MAAYSGGKLVLALEHNERPTACVQEALRLARRLGAQLEIARIVPVPPLEAAADRLGGCDAAAKKCETQRESTVSWLASDLGREARSVRVAVMAGEFAEQAARWAQRRQARLVLVSGETRQAGGMVTALAREAQRPVLGLQGLTTSKPILAATDMRDPQLPVVWTAAELARSLHTSLIPFHSLGPSLGRTETAIRDGVERGPASSSARYTRLVDVCRLLAVPTSPVVSSEPDPAQAILAEAAARGAGLIALGTHYRSWWEHLLARSVAAEVAARSRTAVLIIPIGSDCKGQLV